MPLVRIEYKGDRDYECDRASCRVRSGETLEWECQGRGWYAVSLGWNWPLDPVTHTKRLGERISIPIPKELPRGRYKYTVVVFDEDVGEFFVDDPEFIIKG